MDSLHFFDVQRTSDENRYKCFVYKKSLKINKSQCFNKVYLR